jgi:hypothetical protein
MFKEQVPITELDFMKIPEIVGEMQNVLSEIQKILLREDNHSHICQNKMMYSNAPHPIICVIIVYSTLLSGNYCRVLLSVENYSIWR